jgi:hypothetical protein
VPHVAFAGSACASCDKCFATATVLTSLMVVGIAFRVW